MCQKMGAEQPAVVLNVLILANIIPACISVYTAMQILIKKVHLKIIDGMINIPLF